MKQALVVLAVLFLSSCNSAKKDFFSFKLIPVKQGDYWGYVDKNGKFVVNPQFKNAYTFSEDRALVQNTEGKYGFIDLQGKLVISPVYKDALCFTEGLAAVVKEDQKIEYIDKTGNTVLTLDNNMETAQSFHDGLALVEINGKKSCIDRSGKIAFACPFDYVYDFNEGFAMMRMKIKDESKYGFLDKTGKIAINPTYDDASPFFEGIACVKLNGKYGFIDNTGKLIVTPQFEDVAYCSQGLIEVKQGELWGFVGKDGKYVINPQFKEVGVFTSSGLCPAKDVSSGKWGFIDRQGKMKIAAQFEGVTGFYDGVSIALLDKKYGVIGTDGKYLVNPVYETYEMFPRNYYTIIRSDFFNIASISTILFRDMTSTSIRGLEKGMSYTTVQSKFPDLSHDNYNSLKNFTLEENNSMHLDEIGFLFADDFKIEPKYKTEQRFNTATNTYEDVLVVDGDASGYNDNALLRAITFDYQLQNKAKEKAGNIIKALKEKLPQNFTVESQDENSYILYGSNYNIAIVQERDYIHLVIGFDKATMDMVKNNKPSGNGTDHNAAADSIKK
jgi:hypothetical protein